MRVPPTPPSTLRRTGRGYNGSTRQRLRFSDTTTWLQHPMRGIWSEETIFIQSLINLIPGASPQLHRKRVAATKAYKRRTQRIKIHKEPTRRSRRPTTHLHKYIARIIDEIANFFYELLRGRTHTPNASTRPSTKPGKPAKHAYICNKRLILSNNPQAHTGRILGGATASPPYDDTLWPYYVLHLSQWNKDNHTTLTQPTLSQQEFESKSAAQQHEEFAKIGLIFSTPEELLLQILPIGQDILRLYTDYQLPDIQTAQLTLLEALSHTRILHAQLSHLSSKRKQVAREMANLKKADRSKTTSINPNANYLDLMLELYQLRHTINQHRDILSKVTTRRKYILSTTSKKLPPTTPIVVGHTPYRRPTPTALRPRKSKRTQWSDIRKPSSIPQNALTPTKRTQTTNPLLCPTPVTDPFNAMQRLMEDLSKYGPIFAGRDPSQAFDVIGGFKTDCGLHQSTLSIATLNIDGLDDLKIGLATLLILHNNIDVLVLTDTRHTATSAQYFKKIVQSQLGGATKVYASDTQPREHGRRQKPPKSTRPPHKRRTATSPGQERKKAGPGGIMFLIGPKWGPSLWNGRSDDSGNGALAEIQLRTLQGMIHIQGAYWPERPEPRRIHPHAVNLWSRMKYWLRSKLHPNDDPVTYLQQLSIEWANTAIRTGSTAILMAGDLNSTWTPNERGGQRAISPWCDDNSMINGARLISDHIQQPFITRGHELDTGSWIDHILHIGDLDHIDIIGAFNSIDSIWEGVTDHRPIWAHYSTHPPSTDLAVRPQPAKPRVELPLHDPRQVADFRRRLQEVVSRIPYEGEESQQAEVYLENLTAFIVDTTEEINNSYRNKPRNSFKDGFSPEFLISKWHLQSVIEIRRHILGRKGRRRWTRSDERQRDVNLILSTLRTRALSLGCSPADVDTILNSTDRGPEWWTKHSFTITDCDAEISKLKQQMHGRRRRDNRKKWKKRTAWLENMAEQGKTGKIIKAVLKAQAGRKHRDGLNLDVIKDGAGKHYVTPESVHSAATTGFQSWYDMPENYRETLHTTPDWRPHLNDFSTFRASFPDCQVPEDLMLRIFQALQDVPNAWKVREHLSVELTTAPSLEELTHRIARLKHNSSAGMSGLSYNMLLKAPPCVIQAIYQCLLQFWTDKHIPASWKWRWLVPIPKQPTDTPTLDELRPLMLCEALRKVWSSLILSKIQYALHQHHVLDASQHGYLFGKSTATASLIHINALEDAAELGHDLHRTSYDLKKAFDSVSKPLMLLAWQRLGVPDEVALWLTTMDIGGTTVVRTPFAQHMWDTLKYHCVDTAGTYPPEHSMTTDPSMLLQSFDAVRGTGQGDVTSPTCWIAVMDILLQALRHHDNEYFSKTRYRGDGNSMYPSEETSYADDMESICDHPEHLQAKADIVSAFCILCGLQLSHSKLRRVLQSCLPRISRTVPSMIVHTHPWTPHQVKVNVTEATEYLGGVYDVQYNGRTTLTLIRDIATQHCNTIRHATASAASKIMVATISTLAKIRYKAALSPISLSDLQGVDKIFSKLFRQITHNMESFPTALLHIAKRYGGLGLARFSDEVQWDKLRTIWSSLRSHSLHEQATQGLLQRAARKHAHRPTAGHRLILDPRFMRPGRHSPLYTDSIIQWLHQHDLYLCRHGSRPSPQSLTFPITSLQNVSEGALQQCLLHNAITLGDLYHLHPKTGDREWYPSGYIHTIASMLPSTVPEDPNPLQIGQYWKLRHKVSATIMPGSVIRIDGNCTAGIAITLWTIPDNCKPTIALETHEHLVVTHAQLFPAPTATKVHMVKTAGSLYRIQDLRTQDSPQWPTPVTSSAPPWAVQMAEAAKNLGSSARLYTDGSWASTASVQAVFRPHTTTTHSSASIILKDESPQWKSLPVYIVHIHDGAALQAQSAYTMEFLALAAALKIQVQGCTTTPIGSDANSIITLLPHRHHRLKQCMSNNSIPLQCADNCLHHGCPMPVYVESHPERRKPGDKTDWTNSDWGNFIADRAAAADYATLRSLGIDTTIINVPADEIYNDLLDDLQWYIGYSNGRPILPHGVAHHIEDLEFHRYLQERDNHRASRSEAPYWTNQSLSYTGNVFKTGSAPISSMPPLCRLIYDKYWHGRNRRKDDTLSCLEQDETGRCILCNLPDSQAHTFQHCTHKHMVALREAIMTNLRKHIHQYDQHSALQRQIGRAFLDLLLNTGDPGRVWLGNLSTVQIDTLSASINPETYKHLTQTQLTNIFLPISRILAEGCRNLNHQKLIEERQHALKEYSHTRQHHHPDETTKHEPVQPTPTQDKPTPQRSRLGRQLHRQTPAHTTTPSSLQQTLALPPMTQDTQRRYDVATDPHSRNRLILDHGWPLYGHHFQALRRNEQIHDTTLLAYLRLIANRSEGAIKLFDNQTVNELTKHGAYEREAHKLRRNTKCVFDYSWLLFPVLTGGHFTLITAQPHLLSIDVFDALSTNLTAEAHAVRHFLEHLANTRNKPEFRHWTINFNAAADMERQVGTVDCGIYIAMIADLITTNITLSILTPTFITRCRSYMAKCLLENNAPPLSGTRCSRIQPLPTPRPRQEPAQRDDDEMKSEEEPPLPRDVSSDVETYAPIVHYPHCMLDPTYTWTPNPAATHIPLTTHELKLPAITSTIRERLRLICTSIPRPIRIGNSLIAFEDFTPLLTPTDLPAELVTALFELGLTGRDDVTLLPPYVTHEFSSGERRIFQPLTDNASLLPLRRSILQNPIVVALFALGAHYTAVITNRHTNTISYLNSIHTGAFQTPREVTLVQELLLDERTRQQQLDHTEWTIDFPMAQMEPQQPYRVSPHHPERHIDCGLYALFATLLHLQSQPLSMLQPSFVHHSRLFLAHYVSAPQTSLNMDLFRFRRQTRKVESVSATTPPLHTNTTPLSSMPMSTSISSPPIRQPIRDSPLTDRKASLRPRAVTSIHHQRQHRTRYPSYANDPAQLHTYISDSTIPGAKRGLFADRVFDGTDEDSARIGEYYGGEHLTAIDIYKDSHDSDYAIQVKHIVRDAWDPHQRKVLCHTGYMNDPLDEQLENSMFEASENKIIVTVKPGSKVLPDEEFLIGYGDQAWFSTKFDFPLLQKAVWRYRNFIDITDKGYWPGHPMAHDLFNTPINGQLPFQFTECPCTKCIDARASSASTSSDSSVQAPISRPTRPPNTYPHKIDTKSNPPTKHAPPIPNLSAPPHPIPHNEPVSHPPNTLPHPTSTHIPKPTFNAEPAQPLSDSTIPSAAPTNNNTHVTTTPHLAPKHIIQAHSTKRLSTGTTWPHPSDPTNTPASATPTHSQLSLSSSLHPLRLPTTPISHLARRHNIDLDDHILRQLKSDTRRATTTNRDFSKQVFVADVHNPPGAGKGLYALHDLPAFTIVGIYTGGEQLTLQQVCKPTYESDYVVLHHNLVRDALDHKTRRIHCDVAYINDSLDPTLHNCDWYVHPSHPQLLLVITTADVPNDAQLYIPYGSDYWCQDKFPIDILVAAIKCYNIDIHAQRQWIDLQCYPDLCAHFPPPTIPHTSSSTSPPHASPATTQPDSAAPTHTLTTTTTRHNTAAHIHQAPQRTTLKVKRDKQTLKRYFSNIQTIPVTDVPRPPQATQPITPPAQPDQPRLMALQQTTLPFAVRPVSQTTTRLARGHPAPPPPHAGSLPSRSTTHSRTPPSNRSTTLTPGTRSKRKTPIGTSIPELTPDITKADRLHPPKQRRIDSFPADTHVDMSVCHARTVVSPQARFDFAAFSCIFRTQNGLRPPFEFEFFPITQHVSQLRSPNIDNTSTPLAHILLYDKHIASS